MKLFEISDVYIPQLPKGSALPGDYIQINETALQGPGTYNQDGQLLTAYLGLVASNDNFTKQTPFMQSFYSPEHNDVAIGRIVLIRAGVWLVNVGATRAIPLSIDNLNLPGLLRQRSSADESNMREWLKEGDLICIEIIQSKQSIRGLTRNSKFGKLQYGCPVVYTGQKLRGSQFFRVGIVDIILGSNGIAWVCLERGNCSESVFDGSKNNLDEPELQQLLKIIHIIQMLDQTSDEISAQTIQRVWESK